MCEEDSSSQPLCEQDDGDPLILQVQYCDEIQYGHWQCFRENEQYKNPANDSVWRCPLVEEALEKLTTYYAMIHSRQCADESELAEHVVGLTCSLASCQFRYGMDNQQFE